jgi:hypothetical protein
MANHFEKIVIVWLCLFFNVVLAQSPFAIANAKNFEHYGETWQSATVEEVQAWLQTSPDLEAQLESCPKQIFQPQQSLPQSHVALRVLYSLTQVFLLWCAAPPHHTRNPQQNRKHSPS